MNGAERLPSLGIPDAWLVSGGLFQSVWNHVTGRPATHGIRDDDVFYFDPDTSLDDLVQLRLRPNLTPSFSAQAYRSKVQRRKNR